MLSLMLGAHGPAFQWKWTLFKLSAFDESTNVKCQDNNNTDIFVARIEIEKTKTSKCMEVHTERCDIITHQRKVVDKLGSIGFLASGLNLLHSRIFLSEPEEKEHYTDF